jgi:hypothetical protein
MSDPQPCPDCWNGYTWARAWLGMIAYRLGMIADEQGRNGPMHPWLRDDPQPPTRPEYVRQARPDLREMERPSDDMAELIAGLDAAYDKAWLAAHPQHKHAGRGDRYLGEVIIRAAGLDPAVWGVCQRCGGTAELREGREVGDA